MCNATMEYSESRGTWNVFLGNEWYYEGTFEACCDIVNSWNACDDFQDEYEECEEYEFDEERC